MKHLVTIRALEDRANRRFSIQEKVLLFGQSAGAENAYIIASLPQAPSLINSVISESGGGRSLTSNATQQKVGASYAKALQCSSSNVGTRPSLFPFSLLLFSRGYSPYLRELVCNLGQFQTCLSRTQLILSYMRELVIMVTTAPSVF